MNIKTKIKYLLIICSFYCLNIISANSHEILKLKDDDIIFGKKDAPVTIVEYASLSCTHCAYFHNNVFNKIKEKFIDTGKVFLIFRNFPLDQTSFKAAIASKCIKDSKSTKKFIKLLFKNQESWYTKKNFEDIIANMALISGTNRKDFKKCISNKSLEDHVLEIRKEAAITLEVKATPTFFINEEMYRGSKSFKEMEKIINKNLPEGK